MEKIRFGLIGSGWRSEFFVRIAKAIPDLFELTSVLVRDKERGVEFSKKFDVPVVQNIDELEKTNMDYVVLCTKREAVFDYLKDLYARNIPVLCETPPSDEEKVLEEIWNYTQEHYGKIQVIE